MTDDSTPESIKAAPPRRWWRPQFTIVQMLLVFLIVALFLANWLLRQEIEEVRFATRFYKEVFGVDLQQAGTCTVNENMMEVLPSNSSSNKVWEISIVLNPRKSYKIYAACNKPNSYDKQSAIEYDLYISKANRYVVAKLKIINELKVAFSLNGQLSSIAFYNQVISASLFESSSYMQERKNSQILVNYDKLHFDDKVNCVPITGGNYDLSKPVSLLNIYDPADKSDNATGIHIWLEEVK